MKCNKRNWRENIVLTAETLTFFDELKRQIDQHRDEQIALIDNYLKTCHNPYSTPNDWNPDNIQWEPTKGPKGEYELAAHQDSIDFRLLTRDLNATHGKLERDQYFYWAFQRSAKIGRKRIT
ncbi:MAG: hypothetical protein NWE83_06575 [Candidatus Bathyarchaeota archaeon]|nr:hypothetical protein [Candidatus Bathyarchaeota archaeon]